MDSENKNKLVVGLLAGATVAGLAYYLLFGGKPAPSHDSDQKHKQGSPSLNASQATFFLKDKQYLDLVSRLKIAVESEKLLGKFSKMTLSTISKAIFQLFKSEYLSNYTENRNMRRKYLSSLVDYSDELFKGSRKSEELMKEATNEVLRDLNIDKKFYESEYDRASHEDSNFQMFTIYMLESLKTQVASKSNTKLTKELLIEYFKYQAAIYNDFNFSELRDLTPDNLLLCKQSYICDQAAMKFGIEEEDIIREPLLLNDPEVIDVHRQLQSKFVNDQQNSISFPY
jgi:hypothetical protein